MNKEYFQNTESPTPALGRELVSGLTLAGPGPELEALLFSLWSKGCWAPVIKLFQAIRTIFTQREKGDLCNGSVLLRLQIMAYWTLQLAVLNPSFQIFSPYTKQPPNYPLSPLGSFSLWAEKRQVQLLCNRNLTPSSKTSYSCAQYKMKPQRMLFKMFLKSQ